MWLLNDQENSPAFRHGENVNTDSALRLYEVLHVLTLRNIKVRYRQSLIGIGWAILQPLALMIVFTIVFTRLVKVTTDVPYPVFMYAALLPWTFFANALNRGTNSVIIDEALVKKVPLRAEVYPIAMVFSCLIDLIAASVIFIGLLLWFHLPFSIYMLWSLPLLLLCIIFSIGICFLTSGINAYYRDMQTGMPLVTQIWFYATPIIWSFSQIPDKWRWAYYINPMSPIVESFRRILVYGSSPDYTGLFWSIIMTILITSLGYVIFRILAPKLADVV